MNRLSFFLAALMLVAGSALAQNWTMTDVTDLLRTQVTNASVVAWGDVNGDGTPDLFVGSGDGSPSALYVCNNGSFTDVTSEYLPQIVKVRKAEFLDYDNDGLLDLFVLTNSDQPVQLYRQLPNHRFTAVNVTGQTVFAAPVRSAIWCDVDGDGSLDLVVSNGPTASSPVTVFAQAYSEFNEMRDNPFENLTDVGAMTFADFNRDGRPEIFFGSASGKEPSHFYVLKDATWVDWAQRFDIPPKVGSRSAAWLDYNNDGRPDLFCTGDAQYTTLMHGTSRFDTDGLAPTYVPGLMESGSNGYEVHVVDANMDGWPDLFITKATGCALLINHEGIRFDDRAISLGIFDPSHATLSAAWADFDGNGTPDLAIAQGTNGVRLYRNNVTATHQYMAINVLTRTTHTPLANCNLTMQWQSCKQIASTFPSISTGGCDASTILLVNRTTVKPDHLTLIVQWPNGATQTYTEANLQLGHVNNLYEPSSQPEATNIVAPTSPVTIVPQVISPNPFNPTTNISFNLPAAANVELKVYNVTGQTVASLASGTLAAGNHRVTFDATNLPSGLYFSRLTVNGMSNMTRMLLMK